MWVFFSWLLYPYRRYHARKLRKQINAADDQRRVQRDALDNHQAQVLLATLCDLRRLMDPSIATKVYNNRFCPLTRLPEELLLHIISFLSGDDISQCCLRIASRTFLRLLNPAFQPSSLNRPSLEIRRLLQKDGRCDSCKLWNDANVRLEFDPCKFNQLYLAVDNGSIYCNACDAYHDACRFSFADQQPSQHTRHRRCLGQLGLVPLCEHVHISWASIKDHIDAWRQRHLGGDDWRACLNSFRVECRHADHDTCCTILAAPTWPRATLCLNESLDEVMLKLEWIPHCRVDTLSPSADTQIPAPELRDMFRRLRRIGPVNLLCPGSLHPDALPEMVCFGSGFRGPFSLGSWVQYELGEGNDMPAAVKPSSYLSSHGGPLSSSYFEHGRCVFIHAHYLSCVSATAVSPWCLAVHYKKDIMICKAAAMTDPATKFIPTHPWLHAMDIRTYPHPKATPIVPQLPQSTLATKVYPQWSSVRPLCKEEACVNYYLRAERFCYYPR